MTIYICQVPHRGPARCWTVESEERAISLIQNEFPNAETFDSLHHAIIYDKATALSAESPFELYGEFYWDIMRPRTDAAILAIIQTFEGEAEQELSFDPENENRKIAFNGSFVYDQEEECQILGNERIEGDMIQLLFEHYAKTMMETKHVDI